MLLGAHQDFETLLHRHLCLLINSAKLSGLSLIFDSPLKLLPAAHHVVMLTKHTSGGVSFVQYSNFCTTPTESGTIRFVLPTKPSPLQFRFGSVAGNCQQTTSLGCHQSLTVLFLFCCRELPADHIFGVPSKHESGSVSTLLKGDYFPEQLQDDADLGKSLKEGWRNLGPAGRVSPALCPWPHLLFGCCTELPCNTMWLSALAKLNASLQQ